MASEGLITCCSGAVLGRRLALCRGGEAERVGRGLRTTFVCLI